jgi:hypothetical protein
MVDMYVSLLIIFLKINTFPKMERKGKTIFGYRGNFFQKISIVLSSRSLVLVRFNQERGHSHK